MEKSKLRLCIIRAQPRKFGISFVVPDRVAVEISDRRKIRGKHPIRLFRIPEGGPVEFHRIVKEAEQGSPQFKNWYKKEQEEEEDEERPNPKKAYHRSRFNDWHSQVFYPSLPI